jgi:hypothetical protein
MRNYISILITSIILLGCAYGGPTGSEVLTASAKSNAARLVIYRSASMGLAVQPYYLDDGKPMAVSQPGGFVLCDLPPGHHEVAVDNMPISNNFFGSGSEKVTVDIHAGTTTYLSASPQMGVFTPGQITLVMVTEGQARSDIASLHQSNNSCGRV